MQISSRFTIAIHIFACIDTFKDQFKVTSRFLAGSINVNPVMIRQILAMLKANDLIDSRQGSSGIKIAKEPSQITLLDIFRAVESIDDERLFSFHENPNTDCPVGRNIHNVMDDKLQKIQAAMEQELKSISLQDVLDDTKNLIDLRI